MHAHTWLKAIFSYLCLKIGIRIFANHNFTSIFCKNYTGAFQQIFLLYFYDTQQRKSENKCLLLMCNFINVFYRNLSKTNSLY